LTTNMHDPYVALHTSGVKRVLRPASKGEGIMPSHPDVSEGLMPPYPDVSTGMMPLHLDVSTVKEQGLKGRGIFI